MAMLAVADPTVRVKAVGTAASVPSSDICKLSYYLSCVNSCLRSEGKAIIDPTHTNYQNAASLKQDDQLVIIVLAAILSPVDLLDVCFFVVPDGHGLLGGTANEFLEITAAQQFFWSSPSQGKDCYVQRTEGPNLQSNDLYQKLAPEQLSWAF